MRTPMPSPRGTNHARFFVNPRGAYDAALPEDAAAELLVFLQGKLSDADLAEFCKLAGIDAGMSMDEPEPFKGMPQPSGGKFGQDSRRRAPMTSAQEADFNKRFPHAARIRVNP
jgi:hypothetical protein